MMNEKVQNARELLRIALDMLDECEARVSGALVSSALDALGEEPAGLANGAGHPGALPVEVMAMAIERGRPLRPGLHSCA